MFVSSKQSLKINKIQKHLRFSDYVKTNHKKNLFQIETIRENS